MANKGKSRKYPRRVLALDIGTRSIMGILMEKGDGLQVQAVEYLEHETRSMYDGQIHDVEAVASEIAIIKKRLEQATGKTLKKAAVAAAGRALRTSRGQAVASRHHMTEISWEEIQALELEAVQQAQIKIAQQEKAASDYFCVDYSVVSYSLEDQVIQNLAGQMGNKIEVEVIATFLPRVVVDSLLSALRKAGLEVSNLTLEPIAALSAAIPPGMRLLNLALVDIGAGTSDIAIVHKGKIFAYAMVPLGGDEITEALAERYLLDFNIAEQVKCRLGNTDTLTFADVLENQVSASTAEIMEQIKPQIRDLATNVAREILTANQKAPDAVICVGGGSLTPGLLQDLADALELPSNRVGIRTRESLVEIKGDHPVLTGPQAVTPIGIGINAMAARSLPLLKVKVNDYEIPLWGLHEITVSTALLASGFSLSNIYGRPGMGLTIELNGVLQSFKGTMGGFPTIKVNGKNAALDTVLQEGDRVEFARGQDGEDARLLVRDLAEPTEGIVYLNGEPMTANLWIRVNGQQKSWDEEVPDRSVVEVVMGQPLYELLALSGISPDLLQGRTYSYSLNGQENECVWNPCRARINGQESDLQSFVLFGDRVDFTIQPSPSLREALKIDVKSTSVELVVNNQPMSLPRRGVILQMNSNPVTPDHSLEDGAVLNMRMEEAPAIVNDLLTQITIKPKPRGNLIIRVNGRDAGFTTPVKSGDQVDLYWEDGD